MLAAGRDALMVFMGVGPLFLETTKHMVIGFDLSCEDNADWSYIRNDMLTMYRELTEYAKSGP